MAYPQDKGGTDKVHNTGYIIYGGDGTNFYPIKIDASGNLQIELLASTAVVGNTGHNITGIGDGRVVVAASATAAPLNATTIPAKYVMVTSETNNTLVVAVGGSTVVAAVATFRGLPLYPGESSPWIPCDDLMDIYVDVNLNGEGVTYTYLT